MAGLGGIRTLAVRITTDILLLVLFATGGATAYTSGLRCPDMKENEICCGGIAYPTDLDRECCSLTGGGGEAYVQRGKCREGYAEFDAQLERCGSDTFDHRQYDCCGGTVTFQRHTDKCCRGTKVSTVMPLGSTCCDGLALKAGEMCCRTVWDSLPLAKTHTSHTDCCVNPHTRDIQTYDSSVLFCDTESGEIRKVPPWQNHPSSEGAFPLAPGFNLPPPQAAGDRGCLTEQAGGGQAGGAMKCCGDVAYSPAHETCCRGVLHPGLAEEDAECCYDKAFPRSHPDNPCLTLCGRTPINTEREACCQGRVRPVDSDRQECCGTTLIDTHSQHCCGGMPITRSLMACCQNTWPYYPKVMRCNARTNSVEARRRNLKAQNLARKFCTRSLETWGDHSRQLILQNMLQIQGRVERCGIRTSPGSLTFTLTPVITRDDDLATCLKGGRLRVTVQIPDGQRCLSRSRARRYLRDKTVDIFLSPNKQLRCRKNGASLKLKNGDFVLVLLSKRLDAIMAESSFSLE